MSGPSSPSRLGSKSRLYQLQYRVWIVNSNNTLPGRLAVVVIEPVVGIELVQCVLELHVRRYPVFAHGLGIVDRVCTPEGATRTRGTCRGVGIPSISRSSANGRYPLRTSAAYLVNCVEV
jgi:hypothetical protein